MLSKHKPLQGIRQRKQKMERRMQSSLRESLGEIADPRNLDGAVEEIFQTMLGVRSHRARLPFVDDMERVTAVVGYGGLFSGACIFRCGGQAAREIAGRMAGMSFDEVDDTVKDAVGEICNMLAGSWKGKVPELAAHCGLSVPAVITGRDYNLHVQAPEFRLDHIYAFDDLHFEVTILCDGVQ